MCGTTGEVGMNINTRIKSLFMLVAVAYLVLPADILSLPAEQNKQKGGEGQLARLVQSIMV